MEFGSLVRSCDIGYRYAKAAVLSRFRGEDIDVAAASLLSRNIVIKEYSPWRWDKNEEGKRWSRDYKKELKEFVASMSDPAITEFTRRTGKRLILTKGDIVHPISVIEAIQRTIEIIDDGGYNSMGLIFPRDIHISVTADSQRFPIVVSKNGEISFTSFELGFQKTVHRNRNEQDPNEAFTKRIAIWHLGFLLEDLGLSRNVLKPIVGDLRHVRDVISAYFQIPFLCYDPRTFIGLPDRSSLRFIDSVRGKRHYPDTRAEKSLIRTVWPGVSHERVSRNFDFVRKLAWQVPHTAMLQAIVGHDVGKIDRSGSHPEVGAEYFKSQHFMGSWGLKVGPAVYDAYWLIVKNVVRHHLMPGGISMGEYSFMCLYDVLTEDEMVKIIASGHINVFIDALTLLTACDMAGQKKAMMPLNQRIEDIAELNTILKVIFSGMRDMAEENKEYLFKELLRLSMRRSMLRLCGYLGADDQMLDVNTEGGYESFYGRKLREAFSRLKMSREEKRRLNKFLALASSFPYSARPISFILWKGNEEDPDNPSYITDERSEVNENAIKFLSFLAGQVGNEVLESNKLITVCFADESGKILKGEKDNIIKHPELIRALKMSIDAGERHYPTIVVERNIDKVLVKICIRLQMTADGK